MKQHPAAALLFPVQLPSRSSDDRKVGNVSFLSSRAPSFRFETTQATTSRTQSANAIQTSDMKLHLWVRCTVPLDRKSTRLNSSHGYISYAVFCLKKKNTQQ